MGSKVSKGRNEDVSDGNRARTEASSDLKVAKMC